MNVNGMAASIELYLGVDVLTEDTGEIAPVQWTGYDAGLKKYQGEVLFKDRIQERFRQRLAMCRDDPGLIDQTDRSGLRQVLSSLFIIFHDTDGTQICAQLDDFYARGMIAHADVPHLGCRCRRLNGVATVPYAGRFIHRPVGRQFGLQIR